MLYSVARKTPRCLSSHSHIAGVWMRCICKFLEDNGRRQKESLDNEEKKNTSEEKNVRNRRTEKYMNGPK